jgi:sugar/nucleoside kinase (ribokinase family)
MTKKILGIGNAIVDSIIKSDETMLTLNNIVKGSMGLIYDAQATMLASYPVEKNTSGGSVANSIAAIAQLGASTGFIGKVGSDATGAKFIEEIEKCGTEFLNKNLHSKPSAQSFIMVTADGERTMATYLGCAADLTEDDIKEEFFADAAILYVEGYLWDAPSTIAALKKAITLAKKNGVKIAFSISDSFCILRHRTDFINLIENDVDILFANQNEAMELASQPRLTWDELASDLQKFFNRIEKITAIITRHDNGCVVFSQGKTTAIATTKVKALDTTGAGDAFAGGFLYGLVNGFSFEKSAALANTMGGMIVQKFGARFSNEEIAAVKKTIA